MLVGFVWVRFLGWVLFPFDFPLSSFLLGGYSDCLLSTSWRTKTTHLTQVCTHLFLSVWVLPLPAQS